MATEMTRKQRRSILISAGAAIVGLAVLLVLFALNDSVAFFKTPSDIVASAPAGTQRIRLGGLVEKGSVKRGEGTKIEFRVTDTDKSIRVIYDGVLPDLFREGQGVVTEGRLAATGVFKADTVLAKHDEKYMPKEVAEALKKKGYWKDGKVN